MRRKPFSKPILEADDPQAWVEFQFFSAAILFVFGGLAAIGPVLRAEPGEAWSSLSIPSIWLHGALVGGGLFWLLLMAGNVVWRWRRRPMQVIAYLAPTILALIVIGAFYYAL